MSNKDILRAMSDINDEYIEEAASGEKVSADTADDWTTVQLPPAASRAANKKKSRRWVKWAGGIAAALAVCVIGGSLATHFLGFGGSSPFDAMYQSAPTASGGMAFNSSAKAESAMPMEPEYGYDYDTGFYAADEAEAEMPMTEDMAAGGVSYSSANSAGDIAASTNVKMIYRANVSLQTTDFDESTKALDKLVDEFGGYYENSYVYNGGYYESNVMYYGDYTVRIPAERYRTFLQVVSDQFYVTDLSETKEDVGVRYFEIEGRLRTLRTKEDRLQELLEKAETMSDIIELENALSNTQYEIDMYSTDLNRYDSLIGYSTITMNLRQVSKPSGAIDESPSFGSRISRAFKNGASNFVRSLENFAVDITYDIFGIVLFLICAVIVFFIIRAIVRRIRKKKQTPQA